MKNEKKFSILNMTSDGKYTVMKEEITKKECMKFLKRMPADCKKEDFENLKIHDHFIIKRKGYLMARRLSVVRKK